MTWKNWAGNITVVIVVLEVFDFRVDFSCQLKLERLGRGE